MQKSYNTLAVKRDINLTHQCHLERVELEKNTLMQGDILQFQSEINSRAAGNDFLIRFVIFNEMGRVIGTTYSDYLSLQTGSNQKTFQFSTDLLAPGKYHADIVICNYDGQIQNRHDCVAEAFYFEIAEKEVLYNIPWNYHGWGNIRFSMLAEVQK